jgi:hypothetical protein
MPHERGVEWFAVEVAHRQDRRGWAEDVQDALVEVGQVFRRRSRGSPSDSNGPPLREGQWLPNSTQVRAAALLVLKLTGNPLKP